MPNPSQSDSLFSGCENLGELFLAVHHLSGMPGVETFLERMAPDASRQSLRNAADKLKRVGLRHLGETVRRHARRAPVAPPTFFERVAARKQRD